MCGGSGNRLFYHDGLKDKSMKPEVLASQLRCPNGDNASEISRSMNDANFNLNKKCIDLLKLKCTNTVLEIGPGNGAFVKYLLNQGERISYTGLDLSPEMVTEANQINKHIISLGFVSFEQGNSQKMDFEDNEFDKIFTVHTLYFWDNPRAHLSEIRRVLKKSGTFCIAFGNSKFMQKLPFVKYGFALYDEESASKIILESGFYIENSYKYIERGKSNTGEVVDKIIHIIVCKA